MRDRRAGNSSAGRLLWVVASFILVLFIAAVSYAFYGQYGSQRTEVAGDVDSFAVTPTRTSIEEMDTDGDGIPDWEEALWGTDPNKSDTDGDGTPDARSTTKDAGWRSASADVISSTSTGEASDVTAVATQELIGTYLDRVANQNPSLSPEEQAVLVDQAVRSAAETLIPPVYSNTNFTVVSASPKASEQYTDNMLAILTELVLGAEDDFMLIQDLLGPNKPAALEGLNRAIAHYDTILDRLERITVPDDIVRAHTSFSSALAGYSFMIESIINMESDPVRASAALQLVVRYDEAAATTLDIINTYMGPYK